MADQRSAFRFRVPRLRPSVPPPRPTAPAAQTTARRPPRPQPLPPPPRAPLPSPPPALPVRPPTLEPSVKPTPLLEVQTASSQIPPPNRSLGTVRDSLPEPSVKQTPTSSPPLPLARSLGTVPDSPPETKVKPLSPQHEPQVSSPSHSHPLSSHPSSPSLEPHNPPEDEGSTKEDSNDVQKHADPSTDATPNDTINKVAEETKITPQTDHEDTSMSEHSNSESHIKENPIKMTHHENEETKSILSHPGYEIPEPEYSINTKPNMPQREETTNNVHTEPTSQISNDKSPSVITFAGNNRGTSMHINCVENRRETSLHITRRYKHNPDEITDTTSEGEESSTEKTLEKENEDKNGYIINCNVQGINNSMVFNCSITENNPGVRLGSRDVKKPKRKLIRLMNKNKVKVISPSHKHTIRRRCLRGLFMESSDSDTNDPQKPRRHGCRYSSGEKSNKDDKMSVS